MLPLPEDAHKANQGGCTNGKYHYQSFVKVVSTDEANNTTIIAKTDLTTGNRVRISSQLTLGHTNDLAYNSRTNQIIVANNKPWYTQVSVVNATALTVVENVKLPCPIYGITYSPERDIYFIGCSNSKNLRALDSNFKILDQNIHVTDQNTEKFTTQGLGSDDTFVYCTYWTNPGNFIEVFDWYGNFVGTIETTLSGKLDGNELEGESIDVDDQGRIVLVAGKKIWHIQPKLS